jgi:rhodanese-related sulfurtransferase
MEFINFLAEHWALSLAFVVVFFLLMHEESKMQKLNISVTDLVSGMNDGKLKVIDVRSAEKFAAGHIAGAKNVPNARIKQDLSGQDLLGRVVIIGKSPNEEQSAATKMAKLGCKDYNFLSGGIGAWEKANMPLERSTGNTKG